MRVYFQSTLERVKRAAQAAQQGTSAQAPLDYQSSVLKARSQTAAKTHAHPAAVVTRARTQRAQQPALPLRLFTRLPTAKSAEQATVAQVTARVRALEMTSQAMTHQAAILPQKASSRQTTESLLQLRAPQMPSPSTLEKPNVYLALEEETVAVGPLPQHATLLQAINLHLGTQFAKLSLMDSKCLLVPILTQLRLQLVSLASIKHLPEGYVKVAL